MYISFPEVIVKIIIWFGKVLVSKTIITTLVSFIQRKWKALVAGYPKQPLGVLPLYIPVVEVSEK